MDRTILTGGVSGAVVERLALAVGPTAHRVVEVVVKQTGRREIDALRLLADLDEPAVPRLLAWGFDDHDDRGPDAGWIVIPWFTGAPIGLTAEPPAEVGTVLARIQCRFLDRPADWPDSFDRIDADYLDRALTAYLPATLDRLPDTAAVRSLATRARRVAGRLHRDRSFRGALATFTPTVVHGDLYGLNVLRQASGAVLVIDWGAAAVGPGMFDLALAGSGLDGPAARAFRAEWERIGAPPRDLEREWHWSAALTHTMFAGVVASRASLADAADLLEVAEAAVERLG